jgi:hypothetical protein
MPIFYARAESTFSICVNMRRGITIQFYLCIRQCQHCTENYLISTQRSSFLRLHSSRSPVNWQGKGADAAHSSLRDAIRISD